MDVLAYQQISRVAYESEDYFHFGFLDRGERTTMMIFHEFEFVLVVSFHASIHPEVFFIPTK